MNIPKNDGFTLIEILVVLLIIAIVLAVALMSFGDFGTSRRQQLSLLQLKASIKAAQLDAILQSEVLGLDITPTGYRYYDYQHNLDNSVAYWRPLRHDHLSNLHAFPSKISWSLTTSTPKAKPQEPRIYFLPDGTMTPFKLIIIFNDNQVFTLLLNHSGEVDVEKTK